MISRHCFHALALCALGATLACEENETVPEYQQVLAGTWVAGIDTLESYAFEGAGFKYRVYTPAGDTTWKRNGTFSEDTSYTPWRVDLTVTYDSSLAGVLPRGMLLGIFAFSGDTLRIAVPDTLGYPSRPPNFAEGYGWYSVSTLVKQQ